jgi:hypothetical protein
VGFVDRVLEAVQPTPWYRRWLGSLFLPLSVKLPAEAAALLLVGGLAVFVFQRTPELQQAARQQTVPQAARDSDVVFHSSPPKTMESHPAETPPPPAKTSPPPLSSLPRSVVTSPPSSGVPSRTLLSGSRDEVAAQAEQLAREKMSVASEQKNVAPSERDTEAARKAAPAAPAAPPLSSPTTQELVNKEMRSVQESAAARQAPEPPPPARPAPALDRRIDATKEKALQAPATAPPASGSALRMLPSAAVTGRLAVKDLDTAQRALADLLTQSGAVMISRREDAGTLLVEVAVPKTAYADFNAGLTRIGTWQSEGEPSESTASVRITLRLVQ